ncbi:MAG: calcium/sodium antiporter [Candidatus Kapaibacterium sp.]
MIGQILVDVGILIATVFALWKGADLVVESSAHIAKRFGVSQLVIGLTVVAFGTSAPEFAVTLIAALNDQPNISVGNVVGSNIFNLGFILGGVAIVRTITTSKNLVYRDGLVLFGATLLLLFFIIDLNFERWEGITMMMLLVLYLAFLIFRKDEELVDDVPEGDFSWVDIGKLVGGLVLILAGGHFFVGSAVNLARFLGMSEWAIGVTIVAAGTSAPELATSLVAAFRGKYGLSAGNLIGSDLFNMLGVLGLAGTISPMQVHPESQNSLYMLCALVFVVVVMMRTGWTVSRTEGIILVLVNLIRWFFDVRGPG